MIMTMMTNLGIWIDAKEEEKGMYVFCVICCFACVVGINEHEQRVKRERGEIY